MTAATRERPAVRHRQEALPMLDQHIISPTFGDPRLPPRFWAKVRVGGVPAHRPDLGPCWEWMAHRDRRGYGRFAVGSQIDDSYRSAALAHRVAYEILVGPIPDGLEPDHLCRNQPCINPAHLEPVTHAVNCQRSPLQGRKGETNGNAKLTENQVREIKRLRGVVSQRKLAVSFGVDYTLIGQIQRGQAWKHV